MKDIEFLVNLDLPNQDISEIFNANYLTILRDNPLFEDCLSPFICETLKCIRMT
jgi:hypothetical protein